MATIPSLLVLQFELNFRLLLGKSNIKKIGFSPVSLPDEINFKDRLKCEILKELVLAHSKKGCKKL